jgi:hypothetical protein
MVFNPSLLENGYPSVDKFSAPFLSRALFSTEVVVFSFFNAYPPDLALLSLGISFVDTLPLEVCIGA